MKNLVITIPIEDEKHRIRDIIAFISYAMDELSIALELETKLKWHTAITKTRDDEDE